ncbi:M42 family peptidase [candidate division WOR-3 bacterium]|nr:M42 family peptidase [candidate division WOR-3 bacterium]
MLRELCELHGVSGDESRVRAFLQSKIPKSGVEVSSDVYGNLIVTARTMKSPRVMLAAHMDEVGLMISGITKEGLLKFKAIGMGPNVLMAKRVLVGKEQIVGVIGHAPIHLTKRKEREKIPEIDSLFIDIGAPSKERAAEMVQVGDYAVFDTQYKENGDTLQGKAFDNRIGCYVLLQLLLDTDLPVCYAFTVQEEVGLRGARIAAHRVKPDVAIAVDTTSSGEWPEDRDLPQYPVMGAGPTITIVDRSVICDRGVVSLFRETAEEEGIPYQLKRPMIGGTDAGPMHLAGIGVRAAVISVAARYIHSPMAFASKEDIRRTVQLIRGGIERIMKEGKQWV